MTSIGTDHHRTKYVRDAKPLFERTFLEVHGFTEGRGAVRDRRGAYFIDEEGRPLGTERYRRTYPYRNGIAAAEDELGMFHMDLDGKELYSRRFGWVSEFSEDVCVARYRNGRYTFIDLKGEPWKEDFRYCAGFSSGRGIILTDEGFTYVGISGERPIDRCYDECRPFDGGLAPVRTGQNWYLINDKGEQVSEFMEEISGSGNGLFTGIREGTRYYYNRNGVWQPLHEMMDHVEHDEIPQWTDDILEKEWDSCVVFMRHSERTSHFLCDTGNMGGAPLTHHGDELARSIGKKISSLRDLRIRGYCSSSNRCITTANCIIGGMGAQSKIDISPEIGMMGTAFISGEDFHIEDLRCPGTVWMRRGLNGDIIRGWYSYEKVLRNLHKMMEGLLSEDGSLTICVSHDLFLIPPVAFITGRFPQEEWVEYCEGCLFIRRGDRMFFVWKGQEYPVDPDMEIDIDCTMNPGKCTVDLERPKDERGWMFHSYEDNAWIGKESDGICSGCDREGRFFHGRSDEFPVYSSTYAFVRDFSEQCAPIYMAGRGASFITDFGDYLHNRWFLDTDCYHEGLAAVRDSDGWQYADVDGNVKLKLDCDTAGCFMNGEAFVMRNGSPARIDLGGKITEL